MLHRVALRLNRRVLATTAGVAVVVLYLVAASTTLAGMRGSREVIDPDYHDPEWIVHGDAIVDAHHDPGTLPDVEDRALSGRAVTVQGPDGPIVAVATPDGPEPGQARAKQLPEGPVELRRDGATVEVEVRDQPPDRFDDGWVQIHPDEMDRLAPDGYSFLVLDSEPQDLPDGFHATPTRGVVPFFDAGAAQAQAGLVLVVAVSVLVVAALLYHLMSMEVEARRQEIGVLGGIGATPRRIVGLFVLQAGFIALVAFAFGATGASAVSRILGSASGLAEPTGIEWLQALGLALVVTLTGTAVGAYLPVRRAAESRVVDNLGDR